MTFATTSLIRGDALQTLRMLPAGVAQAVIADPPYGNVLSAGWDNQWKNLDDYLEWNLCWVSECMRILREDGLCFVFGQVGQRESRFLHLSSLLIQNFQFHDRLIWDRVVGYHERRDSLTPAYEEILVLRRSPCVKFNKGAVRIPYSEEAISRYSRDKRYKDRKARMEHLLKGKFLRNIISVPSLRGASKEKVGHPSQKPVALIRILVMLSTDPGDLLLDPFLGSGTTAVAAKELGRLCIGIERNAQYCKMAEKRLTLASAGHVELGRYVACGTQERGK